MQLDPNSNNVSFNLAVTKPVSQEIDSHINFDKLSLGDKSEINNVAEMAAIGNRIAIDSLLNLSLLGESKQIREQASQALFSAYTQKDIALQVRSAISQSSFEAFETQNFMSDSSEISLISIGHAKDFDYHSAQETMSQSLIAPSILESDESLVQDSRTISSGELLSHIQTTHCQNIAIADPVFAPTQSKIDAAIESAKDYGQDIILVPLLENNNHWTALVIDLSNDESVYFNSNQSNQQRPEFLTDGKSVCSKLQTPENANPGSSLTNGCGAFITSLVGFLEQHIHQNEAEVESNAQLIEPLLLQFVEKFEAMSIEEKESSIDMQRLQIARSTLLAEKTLAEEVTSGSISIDMQSFV